MGYIVGSESSWVWAYVVWEVEDVCALYFFGG